MEYAIKLNAVNNPEAKVRAFATVTLGDCFRITNVAVVEGKDNQPFVSMPSFRSKERDEHNQAVYKDVCNPITKEFREELYGKILDLYDEMEQTGKAEIAEDAEGLAEPDISVRVTPFEREGSNVLGYASIYFDNSFVVSNVSILRGKEKEFVSMPSYKTNKEGKDGKAKYRDICFPVTKEFRDAIDSLVLGTYQQEKERMASQSCEQIAAKSQSRVAESRMPQKELPFR